MPITHYCTWGDVAARLSSSGASLRVDDDPVTAQQDVLNEAATEVNGYLELLYSITSLAASNWVKYATRDVACYLACIRRANPVPKSVADRYDRITKLLEKAATGKFVIPDAPQRKGNVPVLSNQSVRQYPVSQIKTDTQKSTGHAEGYQQHNSDFSNLIDYSI